MIFFLISNLWSFKRILQVLLTVFTYEFMYELPLIGYAITLSIFLSLSVWDKPKAFQKYLLWQKLNLVSISGRERTEEWGVGGTRIIG